MIRTVDRKRRVGFTLVEIALALLVVSVGAMAILGLFPAGLEANQRAIGETRAALFAEDVLNSYRAASRRIPWQDLDSYSAPAVAATMWSSPDDLAIRVNTPGDNTVHVNVYALFDDESIVEFAVRYRLRMEDVSPDIKQLRLEVWPGEFGQDDPDEAMVFLTELYHSGITDWPSN